MSAHGPTSLTDLCQLGGQSPSWRINLILPDIAGGKMSKQELSSIERCPQATALVVSGLSQDSFEFLVSTYGHQFTGIYLWKCPRIEDLTPLEALPQLTFAAAYWNQRAMRLWDCGRTPRLRGLEFRSFGRLRDLSDVQAADSLTELRFGQAWSDKAVYASLEPLASLGHLRSLDFAATRIEDRRIQPLARLQQLESFSCPTNLFTTKQCAWLRAHLPPRTRGRVLQPVELLEPPLERHRGPPADVLVIGKGKPFLSSEADAERVQRYVDEYWRMVDEFRSNPELQP